MRLRGEWKARLKFKFKEIIPQSLWLQEVPGTVESGCEVMNSSLSREDVH